MVHKNDKVLASRAFSPCTASRKVLKSIGDKQGRFYLSDEF